MTPADTKFRSEKEVGLSRGRRIQQRDLEIAVAVAVGIDVNCRVRPRSRKHQVGKADAKGREVDLVGAGHEIEDCVIAGSAAEDERVDACPAQQAVGAGVALQSVIAKATDQKSRPSPPCTRSSPIPALM